MLESLWCPLIVSAGSLCTPLSVPAAPLILGVHWGLEGLGKSPLALQYLFRSYGEEGGYLAISGNCSWSLLASSCHSL